MSDELTRMERRALSVAESQAADSFDERRDETEHVWLAAKAFYEGLAAVHQRAGEGEPPRCAECDSTRTTLVHEYDCPKVERGRRAQGESDDG